MVAVGDPLSWYPVALSGDVRTSPRPISIFGGEFVAFRHEGGKPSVIGRYCAHMGTDLARAELIRDGLRCRLHGWEYGGDGACRHVPGQDVSMRLRLPRLACAEWGGVLFVWPGPRPDWPLPTIPDSIAVTAARPRVVDFDSPFTAIALNGFDIWHFMTVHRREVISRPDVRSENLSHLGMSFTARICPGRIYDDLLVALGYGTLSARIDCWGGNLIFVRNEKARYTAVLALAPLRADRCRMYLCAFSDRQEGWIGRLLQVPRLELHRAVAWAFLKADVPIITGMRPKEGALIPGRDDVAREFWRWWNVLPRIEALQA
jgi:aminopyrrolnitrin oxygenase